MSTFKKTQQKLTKLESATFLDVAQVSDDAVVEIIVRVNESGYVPEGVELRSHIDDTLFTASTQKKSLERLDQDPKVDSIAVSERLRHPE